MTDQIIQNALANESRLQQARQKAASHRGSIEVLSTLGHDISVLLTDVQRQLTSANAEIMGIEQGAGPGVTADFGERSTLDQNLRVHRFSGKEAAVDFIKENPLCEEEEAIAAWVTAEATMQAGLPEYDQFSEEDMLALAAIYGRIYRKQLLAAGRVSDLSWEAQRAWIVSTDKTVIMGL